MESATKVKSGDLVVSLSASAQLQRCSADAGVVARSADVRTVVPMFSTCFGVHDAKTHTHIHHTQTK
eukprot:6438269-Amphidinium_carterae.1